MKECGSQDKARCDECNSTDDCEDYCPCRCLDNYVSDWMKDPIQNKDIWYK